MSGGSFGNLYNANSMCEVAPCLPSYEEMADQLVTYGEVGRQARRDMEMLINCQRLSRNLHERLERVMHDVEWHVSRDYGEDQVKEQLAKYAKENP